MAGGAASGYVMTGSFKGALTGAFSAAAFYGIGSYFQGAMEANKLREGLEVLENGLTTAQFAGKIATHAIAGGVMSDLSGGKFGHGFFAAGVTQAAGLKIDGIDSASKFSPARIVTAAVLGGTVSKISGGKFANGAFTAAFSRAFNDELHFNGKKLSWIDDDGKVVKQWPAVSGAPGTTPDDQTIKNKGPIPEGGYSVDPDKSNYDKWYKMGWGNNDSWGDVRTIIEPNAGTNTFGRDQMYMHGGAYPGSIGCIDLTIYNNAFHNMLQSYGQPINLTVDY